MQPSDKEDIRRIAKEVWRYSIGVSATILIAVALYVVTIKSGFMGGEVDWKYLLSFTGSTCSISLSIAGISFMIEKLLQR
jgi:hypothetical protein